METNQTSSLEKMEVDEEPATSSASQSSSKDKDTGASSKQQQQQSSKVLFANPSTVASVSISLHPLVLMNMSEHWTRIRAQEGAAKPVYGALIGKQQGRKLELLNSFELKFEIIDNDVIINKDYYNMKEEQCEELKKVKIRFDSKIFTFQISKFLAN